MSRYRWIFKYSTKLPDFEHVFKTVAVGEWESWARLGIVIRHEEHIVHFNYNHIDPGISTFRCTSYRWDNERRIETSKLEPKHCYRQWKIGEIRNMSPKDLAQTFNTVLIPQTEDNELLFKIETKSNGLGLYTCTVPMNDVEVEAYYGKQLEHLRKNGFRASGG